MLRIKIYLLLFFIAFTHSAVAMDIHASDILGQESASIQDESFMDLSKNVIFEGHDILNEHCPHSSSHTSGIISSILLPSYEEHRSFNLIVESKIYTVVQSPPLRPPKA